MASRLPAIRGESPANAGRRCKQASKAVWLLSARRGGKEKEEGGATGTAGIEKNNGGFVL
jgi:hypothetical protein